MRRAIAKAEDGNAAIEVVEDEEIGLKKSIRNSMPWSRMIVGRVDNVFEVRECGTAKSMKSES